MSHDTARTRAPRTGLGRQLGGDTGTSGGPAWGLSAGVAAWAAAFVLAALVSLPLVFDGAYYLFACLDRQGPMMPHRRVAAAVLQLPLLAVMRAGVEDVTILRTVFCLCYALIPATALILSLLVLRPQRSLAVWPVLGIAYGTLPAQPCFVCEVVTACQIAWPLMLVLVTRPQRAGLWVMAGAAALGIFLLHPAGAVLLAVLAAVAIASHFAGKPRRRLLPAFAIALGGLSALRFVLLVVKPTQWEKQTLSDGFLAGYFPSPQAAVVLFFLLLAALSLLLVLSPGIPETASPWWASAWFRVLVPTALAVAPALPLLPWSLDTGEWRAATAYRGWALPLTVVLLGLAAVATLRPGRRAKPMSHVELAVLLSAGVVVVALSLSWHSLVSRFRSELASATGRCLAVESLVWLPGTVLDSWSTPSLALVLQRRRPDVLVLPGDACEAARTTGNVAIVPWFTVKNGASWWELGPRHGIPEQGASQGRGEAARAGGP